MKKLCLISLFALATSSAMAGDMYVTATMGQSQLHKVDTTGLDSFDTKDQGFALAVGQTIVPHFDVEVGYNKFGTFNGSVLGQTFEVEGKAFQASMIGSFEVKQNTNMFMRVGVIQTKAKTLGFSDKKSSVLYGVGATYKMNDTLDGVVEYQYVPKVAFTEKAMSSVNIGLKYRF